MKGLNLDENKIEDEEIKFGDKKFVVTANMPRSLYYKFFGNDKKESTLKEKNEEERKAIIELLSLKNDSKEVETFINGLKIVDFVRVDNFIAEYITECFGEAKKKLKEESK